MTLNSLIRAAISFLGDSVTLWQTSSVKLNDADTFALAWFASFSAVSFLVFGFDKWKSSHNRWRVPESSLVWLGLLGGWPGGWLGMMLFRHKSAKRAFQFKYALALIPFAAEIWVWRHWR